MGNTFFPNATINRNRHMDNGGKTTNIQKKHKPDNTIVLNKTQIVQGYQLNILKIVSNPGSP